MNSMPRDGHLDSKTVRNGGKVDTTMPDVKTRMHPLTLDPSNMKTPSMKECILSFLLMCCFAATYNYGISFWEDNTAPAYTSFLRSWRTATGHWIVNWSAAPQAVQLDQVTRPPFSETPMAFANTTLRQTIQLTTGGEKIRIRLSNRFGATDLTIDHVTIALTKPYYGDQLGSRSIEIDTLRTVTFGGNEAAIIADGALAVSDPILFDRPVDAGQVLTVTMYLREGQDSEYITAHVGSRTTTWMAFGDYSRADEMPIGVRHHGPHWYFLSAVEVWKDVNHRAFAVLGDSITNGRGGRMNLNTKWTTLLFNRMQEASPGLSRISVINQGAGGDQLLQDGRGPNAAARLDSDVLAQSGVGYVMIFEGINDIGNAAPTVAAQQKVEARLIQSYKQTILRVHAFGIPIFGSTLTPFMCHESTTRNKYARYPIREQTRLSVNNWIRYSGWFDAIVDFDAFVRDASNNTQMAPQYNSGDCLHPNDDGFEAMASRFPLEIFERFDRGVNNFT